MRQKKNGLLLIVVVMLLLTGFLLSSCSQELTPDEAKVIAKEAYIYGFPLVLNYKTMYSYAINKKSPEW